MPLNLENVISPRVSERTTEYQRRIVRTFSFLLINGQTVKPSLGEIIGCRSRTIINLAVFFHVSFLPKPKSNSQLYVIMGETHIKGKSWLPTTQGVRPGYQRAGDVGRTFDMQVTCFRYFNAGGRDKSAGRGQEQPPQRIKYLVIVCILHNVLRDISLAPLVRRRKRVGNLDMAAM